MPTFPPMPPPPATPVTPNILRGELIDRSGNDIAAGVAVIAVNETHPGDKRVLIRAGGEILFNIANFPDGATGDKIRVQCIDRKRNGEVWYSTVEKGATNISKVVRPINPICDKRMIRFPLRSVVK